MPDPDVVPFSKQLHDEYDSFLLSVPESLLYYSRSYKALLESLLGCNSRYLIALEEGAITGVLPIMETEGPLGRVMNSLPFYGSHGGVLARSDRARNALVEEYSSVVAAEDVVTSVWIENPFVSTGVSPPHDIVDTRLSHSTPLTGLRDEDELMAVIRSSARRNVRKAQAENTQVEIDNNAWEYLEEMHTRTMRAIGGKPKSHQFFQAVPHLFTPGEEFNIFVATRHSRPIAALLVFYFNKTVEYFTPVTTPEERERQPMAAILVAAMTDAARRGFENWNWGGTWLSQDGVAKFKTKWGAREEPYCYFIKVRDQQILGIDSTIIAQSYPNFYVVPFNAVDVPHVS